MGAAEQLLGQQLSDGWYVISPAADSKHGTGGNFSVGYIVEKDGKRAFLKALDFSRALRADDPSRALQALTESFNFERDVLNKCKQMDRVVTAIADGSYKVSDKADGVVQYLIFELAKGDARSQFDLSKRFDLTWALRALHHVATGLWQLHRKDIAHQDVKPSNVLIFDGTISKVADLGRAAHKGVIPPHEALVVPGDPTYAPPELLYGFIDPDWNKRRIACDLFLLGSMVVFFFAGAGITAQLLPHLHEAHTWKQWKGSYHDVLPYVRTAFEQVLSDFHSTLAADFQNQILTDKLVGIVKQLSDPDPSLRGHPKNLMGSGDQYSLERFVAEFDLLATRAELRFFKPA